MFDFALSMWVQRRVSEAWVRQIATLGRITEEQKELILKTPQDKF